MELSENSELRAATIDQAKSTGYFMQLRVWPEFDLIRPAGANRLIVGSKTVRTIDGYKEMRISKLHAENVHGYLPIDVSFFDELTFLTGLNGSGKTSALRLLMALLTPNIRHYQKQ